MKGTSAALAGMVLALVGCPATNSPDDAGILGDAEVADARGLTDGPAEHDAPRIDAGPDAFACPDRDGDGDPDFACGGGDCDDEDATLSSELGPCSTPTATRRCVGGAAVDVECGGDTPYCDARVGECVADACGDHVVHANEVCDATQAEGCLHCLEVCINGTDCTVAGSVCRPLSPDDVFGNCLGIVDGGAANGTPCVRWDECHSGYCGDEGRCTEIATYCPPPFQFSELQAFRTGSYPITCHFECQREADCVGGALCLPTLMAQRFFGDGMPNFVANMCVSGGARGPRALGEPCSYDRDCDSLVCVLGACSLACRDDADCGAGAPRCLVTARTDMSMASERPPEWGVAWPRVCVP
ncbi:MAG: hypothetical protein K1X94_25950 [Sandaracinaceae bacterium]|nr:hypothetical protein [Sandaracinaceae bacterium]